MAYCICSGTVLNGGVSRAMNVIVLALSDVRLERDRSETHPIAFLVASRPRAWDTEGRRLHARPMKHLLPMIQAGKMDFFCVARQSNVVVRRGRRDSLPMGTVASLILVELWPSIQSFASKRLSYSASRQPSWLAPVFVIPSNCRLVRRGRCLPPYFLRI